MPPLQHLPAEQRELTEALVAGVIRGVKRSMLPELMSAWEQSHERPMDELFPPRASGEGAHTSIASTPRPQTP